MSPVSGLVLSNQRPALLNPLHQIPIAGLYDPTPHIRAALVDPFFEPLAQGATVQVLDAQGNNLDQDAILQLIMRTMAPGVDNDAEDAVCSLYRQGLAYYTPSQLLANEVFVIQAGSRHRMPPKSPMVLYTAASDVLPAAKMLLAGRSIDGDGFFASLAYTYAPETLGFWFQSSTEFDDFTKWIDQQIHIFSSVLPADSTRLLSQFTKLKLSGLTEALVLRNEDDQENHEYAFARVIVSLLMQYEQEQEQRRRQQGSGAPPVTGVLPFLVSELFLPRTLVLVNVEAHARASAREIDKEWRMINASLHSPVKVISHRNLAKLTALPRAAAQAAAKAANASTNKYMPSGRYAQVQFRAKQPTPIDLASGLARVLKKRKEVNRSQNIFKKSRITFSKPNRRDPDDYNKPGRITSTHYLPDLHIYLDCSGSIEESNYQQAVIMLIRMAKKLNVNLYFNSFSHQLSQESLLRTQNASVNQAWRSFRQIPKVSGGTDYAQIWQYINASPKRAERISLVITDFQWLPEAHRQEHPRNLYYAPISNTDWDSIVHWVKKFERGMRHIEPGIAGRLIGLTI
ncbi:hypothetical protein [Nocardiopsis synnemataformans]|uniref:hypothetical protein n=1 Tax=Nocardiopsis synnemataformans TaxID=61305 RepID=UPI003EBECA0E